MGGKIKTDKDPAFLFYHKDWLASTSHMSAFSRGCFIQLLVHQANQGDLPSDIEELASLAGIKFSEFEAFKQAWRNSLQEKFKILPGGNLFNNRLSEVIEQRKNFGEKQRKRGKIGSLFKQAIKDFSLNKIQQNTLRELLSNNRIYDLNEEDSIKAFKHMLKAFIESEDVNEIKIINKDKVKNNEGGVGETKANDEEVIMPFGEEFSSNWNQWKKYLKDEFKGGYRSIQSEQAALKRLSKLSQTENEAIEIIHQSMANRWKGLFEINIKSNSNINNYGKATSIYSAEFIKKHIS